MILSELFEDFADNHPLLLISIVMVMILAPIVYLIIKESNDWESFKLNHKCKVVSKSSSTIGTGIGSDGQVITTVNSGKTGYLCDDGITYYR